MLLTARLSFIGKICDQFSYHIMVNTKKTGVGEIFTTLDDTLQSEERQIVHF